MLTPSSPSPQSLCQSLERMLVARGSEPAPVLSLDPVDLNRSWPGIGLESPRPTPTEV